MALTGGLCEAAGAGAVACVPVWVGLGWFGKLGVGGVRPPTSGAAAGPFVLSQASGCIHGDAANGTVGTQVVVHIEAMAAWAGAPPAALGPGTG